MENKIIVSRENSLFKEIKKLRERKYREQSQQFLAEGVKIFQNKKEYVLMIGDYTKYEQIKNLEYISADEKSKMVYFDSKLFCEISSQENSQGIITVYNIPKQEIKNISENIIVLDKIQDPGNMGTLIRTIDASGFRDVVINKGCVDIYNEKTVRAAMGSLLNLKYYYMEEKELIEFLKNNSYKIISSALTNNSKDYNEMCLSQKNALVFGNEGNGISMEILNESNEIVKIPIYGGAESLNVSVAGGILLYKFREILNLL